MLTTDSRAICILTLKFLPLLGGDVTHTAYLSRLLARHGFYVNVVTIKPYRKRQKEMFNGVSIHRVGLPASTMELELLGLKRIAYMILTFFRVAKLLREGKVDLWSHSWEIEQYDLWRKLEETFKHVSEREDVQYLTNYETVRQHSTLHQTLTSS